MTRLRDFLEQVNAESQTLCNRELVHSLASGCLWKVHMVRADGSWRRCESRRALSPWLTSTSATAPASEAVGSPVFNSCRVSGDC